MTKAYAQHGDAAGTFLGHPKGLFVLFFAEMWERFSYYGMRALLIFYLTKHWLFSDSESGVIYGAYTALVYITPVLGGYLADRWLGQRKAVAYGAILLTFGHFIMGFEGDGGQDPGSLSIFWLALAFIIVGSGFLKANISVIVGQLYPRTDVRRDGAYTIFYMGINLGAFLGSLLCGYLGETYGWSYGFGAAGFGMLLGLIVFIWGKPLLLGRGEPDDPAKLAQPVMGIKFEWLLYIVGLLAVGVCWWMVQNQALVGTLLGVAGAALVLYVVFTAVVKLPPHDRDRIFAAMFLILGSILFWALFEQAGSSLNLFADRYVDRAGVPASVFQSLNAGYIVLFAPVFATLWTWLGRRGWEPSAPAKFGLAMLQLGLGFFVLKWGAEAAGLENATPVLFIFLIYLLHTTGELCLSPVGLSAMNRLAPAHMASLIMGTWFFASATGNFAAGLIAAATGSEKASGEGAGKALVLDVYGTIGLWAIGFGVLVILVSPLIKKLMHLDTLRDAEDLAGESELAEPQAAGVRPEPKGA
ncbi:peptide MFS transporter [Sphingopyxis sp. JAI128]|uniref:peptide MFS transporter n=1 Tax=Sphingopyxis sp. JAI128 TaxID=2723066 RepID=UPI00161B02EC|nr:peptide MFS transporter [Sphingopyxis sp. JAI128]MBB6424801.1 POT family proton-dependent oligopeptide transporter [Sphingopyxis sp. JAI128]